MIVVGVLGNGQLGQMLAEAAVNIGVDCRLYPMDLPDDRIVELLRDCSVITVESENVSDHILTKISAAGKLNPQLSAIHMSRHRLKEKTCFQSLGMDTTEFISVETPQDLDAVIEKWQGLPFILKTTTMGYDGKGQRWIDNVDDLKAEPLDFTQTWIAEKIVPFVEEVSLVAARDAMGHIVYYPLVQNQHRAGILRQTRARPNAYTGLQLRAESMMSRLMTHFDYVGVLTIEFFVTSDGKLLVNECAPRVHNSGHWSIEGAKTSQFENHLRAICQLPLGTTDFLVGAAGMINLIGTYPDTTQTPQGPYYWHDYHKTPRANRKLGHVTITASDPQSLERDISRMEDWLGHHGFL